MKEGVKKGAVIEEKDAELLWDSKDTVSVEAGNKLAGDGKGTAEVILVTAGGAKTAFAAEGDKLIDDMFIIISKNLLKYIHKSFLQ